MGCLLGFTLPELWRALTEGHFYLPFFIKVLPSWPEADT